MMNTHMKCWLWKGLWGLGIVAFLLAWISVIIQKPIGALDPLFLFWNSLILGILAIPIKLDCKNCNVCSADSHDHSRHEGM